MPTDRNVAIAELGKAVAAIMDIGVAEMSNERKIEIARALVSGAAEIRIVFLPSTQIVIAGLYSADHSVPPQELFRIDGSSPTGIFQ